MSAFSAAAQDEDGDIISALLARVADLEAQLYAIGAGGVGSPVARQDHPEQHLDMVPEGWKLVPVEPTTKMIDAARSQSSFPAGVWRAMIAAAPQPPVVEQPQGGQEPICWVTGYYGGHCTVAPCNGATVLPVGMALYTRPKPKREPLTDAQINDHRLALPYDGEDLPDPWDFKQGVRAAERAHGIGGDA